jgi:hypothetical protein
MFLVFSPIVLGADFSIDIEKKDFYVATQEDFITLRIHNPMQEDWFSIGFIGPENWVEAETSLLRVPTAGSEEMKIRVSPPKDVVPLLYPYQYFVKIERLSTDSVLEESILIKVKQITNAIIRDFKLSCTECTDEVIISGTVYNVGSNPIDLSMVFKVGNQVKTLSIGYVNIYGKRDFETTIDLKDWEPGTYDVQADLIDVEGRKMYEESGSFRIPLLENIIYDKDVSSTIFGSTITVTATNNGNSEAELDLRSVNPKTWYSIYSGPAPTGMAISDHYSWRISLEPEETKSVSYSEVYWPTYAIILLIVGIVGLSYWQSSPFDFYKNVHGLRRIQSGKDISVSLHLKNKKKPINKAVIKDIVPSGFAITSKFETIKPVIKKIGGGVELNWKLNKVKPHEERVFHYTVKPTKLGRKSLPPATVKAATQKKLVKKKSNRVYLGSEKEDVKFVTVKVKPE